VRLAAYDQMHVSLEGVVVRYAMSRRFVALVSLLLVPAPAFAWWVKGHEAVARAAVASLPADVPAFFRAGAAMVAHCAGDPDRWKNRAAVFLKAAEAPDHFVDLEDYEGQPFPDDRYKAIELLIRLGRRPHKTGMLPYALMEHFERLSVAFYDYRQAPVDESIRAKCLVYAGVLSHFTGDAVMPLHATRAYDGRQGPGGALVQQGIHAAIDSFPERNNLASEEMARGLAARDEPDPWKRIQGEIAASHKLVDQCYELDKAGAFAHPTESSRAFILQRCRAGVQFTADLYYAAWKKSALLQPPF
jgi:hypothetical protein